MRSPKFTASLADLRAQPGRKTPPPPTAPQIPKGLAARRRIRVPVGGNLGAQPRKVAHRQSRHERDMNDNLDKNSTSTVSGGAGTLVHSPATASHTRSVRADAVVTVECVRE